MESSLKEQFVAYAVRYQKSYYRLAYSYVKNVDDALDIVQESICKALASVDSLKNSSHIKAWFYRIVVNTSLDFLRKQKKVLVTDEETLDSYDPGTIDQYQNIDLQRALENLPEQLRIVVILRYFEDLKLEEIAQVLHENISTVKSRLYRSLEKLQL